MQGSDTGILTAGSELVNLSNGIEIIVTVVEK